MFLFRKLHFDRKTRLVYAAANLCLFIGIALALFTPRWAAQHRLFYDGLRGFLLGLTIALLLWVVRLKQRPAPPVPGNG